MPSQLRPLLRTGVPLAMYSHYAIRNLSATESSAAVAPVPTDITIYQYKICPYCNRPKTFLDYMKIPYKAVEVNPMTKSQLSFSKEYKKVPIMTMKGDVIVADSAKIIEALKDLLSQNPEKKKVLDDLFTEDT